IFQAPVKIYAIKDCPELFNGTEMPYLPKGIAYSVYEMQRIKESLLPNIKLVVMYDIACILDKHIKNNHKLAGLQDVPLAIPIFHCYGHKSSCQVRLTRSIALGKAITEEMEEIAKSLSVTTELLPIQEWMQQELNAVLPVENVLAKEWDEEYVELIEISKTLRNDVRVTLDEEKNILDTQRKLNRNEKTLTNIEKKNGVRKRWTEADATFHSAKKRLTEKSRTRILMRLHKLASERAFLLEMKRKYAEMGIQEAATAKDLINITENEKAKLLIMPSGTTLPDPLSLKDNWLRESEDMTSWPPIFLSDITVFLMEDHPGKDVNFHERILNEYKEGKAYRLFDSGWLKEVFIHQGPVARKVNSAIHRISPIQRIKFIG
ncbi:hypothetical protein QZH41_002976, partial [Actinostola sp. cb2023]